MALIKKIDILWPEKSLYGVLHHFTKKIFEAFSRKKIICRLLKGDDRVVIPLNDPPDLTLSFGGAAKIESGELLCDYMQVPHISCLVDPSFRFLDLTKSSYLIMTCDDEASVKFLKDWGFRNVFFLPHAVEKELIADSLQDRIYDIVMIATFIDSENRRKVWRRRFPKSIWQKMEEAVSIALIDQNRSFIPILLEQFFPSSEMCPELIDKDRLFELCSLGIFDEVELYIKGKDRIDLLTSFENSEVHVFGGTIDRKNWKTYLKKYSNIVVHRELSYEQSLEVMKKSKIVLNSCIKNPFGAHERIFSAQACGAVVVANNCPFLRRHYFNGKEMLFYNRLDFGSLEQEVQLLLKDHRKREEIAALGRKIALSYHTWDHRVASILNEVSPVLENISRGSSSNQ